MEAVASAAAPGADWYSGLARSAVASEPSRVTLAESKRLEAAKRQERNLQKAQQDQQAQRRAVEYHNQNVGWARTLQDCPVYYPTEEQFADPVAYIRSIQAEAAAYGLCKVVPPCSAAIPPGKVLKDTDPDKKQFSFRARIQEVKAVRWTNWHSGDFLTRHKRYTLSEYQGVANAYATRKYGSSAHMPPHHVEVEYWRQRERDDTAGERQRGSDTIEYANDLEGTAFARPESGDPLGASPWNLNVLPEQPALLLPYLQYHIPGVTSPMLYIGMLHATFAWHIEDHYLYSINYHHMGAPKTWYGVPAASADAFEHVVLSDVYGGVLAAEEAQGVPSAQRTDRGLSSLLNKTTVVHPQLLMDKGVKLYRATQNAGEFVITFPRAYHAGFSHGFNCGEAVNFAMPEWLPYGMAADARLSRLRRRVIMPVDYVLCAAAIATLARITGAQQGEPQQQEGGDGGAGAAAQGLPSGTERARGGRGHRASGGRCMAGACAGPAGEEAEGEGPEEVGAGGAGQARPRVALPFPAALRADAARLGVLSERLAAAVAQGAGGRPPPELSTLLCFWRVVRQHLTRARALARGGAGSASAPPDGDDTVCSLCEASCFLGFVSSARFAHDRQRQQQQQQSKKQQQQKQQPKQQKQKQRADGRAATPAPQRPDAAQEEHGREREEEEVEEQRVALCRCLSCACAAMVASRGPQAQGAGASGSAGQGGVGVGGGATDDMTVFHNARLSGFVEWARALDGQLCVYTGPQTSMDVQGEGLREVQLYGTGCGLAPELYGWGAPYDWGDDGELAALLGRECRAAGHVETAEQEAALQPPPLPAPLQHQQWEQRPEAPQQRVGPQQRCRGKRGDVSAGGAMEVEVQAEGERCETRAGLPQVPPPASGAVHVPGRRETPLQGQAQQPLPHLQALRAPSPQQQAHGSTASPAQPSQLPQEVRHRPQEPLPQQQPPQQSILIPTIMHLMQQQQQLQLVQQQQQQQLPHQPVLQQPQEAQLHSSATSAPQASAGTDHVRSVLLQLVEQGGQLPRLATLASVGNAAAQTEAAAAQRAGSPADPASGSSAAAAAAAAAGGTASAGAGAEAGAGPGAKAGPSAARRAAGLQTVANAAAVAAAEAAGGHAAGAVGQECGSERGVRELELLAAAAAGAPVLDPRHIGHVLQSAVDEGSAAAAAGAGPSARCSRQQGRDGGVRSAAAYEAAPGTPDTPACSDPCKLQLVTAVAAQEPPPKKPLGASADPHELPCGSYQDRCESPSSSTSSDSLPLALLVLQRDRGAHRGRAVLAAVPAGPAGAEAGAAAGVVGRGGAGAQQAVRSTRGGPRNKRRRCNAAEGQEKAPDWVLPAADHAATAPHQTDAAAQATAVCEPATTRAQAGSPPPPPPAAPPAATHAAASPRTHADGMAAFGLAGSPRPLAGPAPDGGTSCAVVHEAVTAPLPLPAQHERMEGVCVPSTTPTPAGALQEESPTPGTGRAAVVREAGGTASAPPAPQAQRFEAHGGPAGGHPAADLQASDADLAAALWRAEEEAFAAEGGGQTIAQRTRGRTARARATHGTQQQPHQTTRARKGTTSPGAAPGTAPGTAPGSSPGSSQPASTGSRKRSATSAARSPAAGRRARGRGRERSSAPAVQGQGGGADGEDEAGTELQGLVRAVSEQAEVLATEALAGAAGGQAVQQGRQEDGFADESGPGAPAEAGGDKAASTTEHIGLVQPASVGAPGALAGCTSEGRVRTGGDAAAAEEGAQERSTGSGAGAAGGAEAVLHGAAGGGAAALQDGARAAPVASTAELSPCQGTGSCSGAAPQPMDADAATDAGQGVGHVLQECRPVACASACQAPDVPPIAPGGQAGGRVGAELRSAPPEDTVVTAAAATGSADAEDGAATDQLQQQEGQQAYEPHHRESGTQALAFQACGCPVTAGAVREGAAAGLPPAGAVPAAVQLPLGEDSPPLDHVEELACGTAVAGTGPAHADGGGAAACSSAPAQAPAQAQALEADSAPERDADVVMAGTEAEAGAGAGADAAEEVARDGGAAAAHGGPGNVPWQGDSDPAFAACAAGEPGDGMPLEAGYGDGMLTEKESQQQGMPRDGCAGASAGEGQRQRLQSAQDAPPATAAAVGMGERPTPSHSQGNEGPGPDAELQALAEGEQQQQQQQLAAVTEPPTACCLAADTGSSGGGAPAQAQAGDQAQMQAHAHGAAQVSAGAACSPPSASQQEPASRAPSAGHNGQPYKRMRLAHSLPSPSRDPPSASAAKPPRSGAGSGSPSAAAPSPLSVTTRRRRAQDAAAAQATTTAPPSPASPPATSNSTQGCGQSACRAQAQVQAQVQAQAQAEAEAEGAAMAPPAGPANHRIRRPPLSVAELRAAGREGTVRMGSLRELTETAPELTAPWAQPVLRMAEARMRSAAAQGVSRGGARTGRWMGSPGVGDGGVDVDAFVAAAEATCQWPGSAAAGSQATAAPSAAVARALGKFLQSLGVPGGGQGRSGEAQLVGRDAQEPLTLGRAQQQQQHHHHGAHRGNASEADTRHSHSMHADSSEPARSGGGGGGSAQPAARPMQLLLRPSDRMQQHHQQQVTLQPHPNLQRRCPGLWPTAASPPGDAFAARHWAGAAPAPAPACPRVIGEPQCSGQAAAVREQRQLLGAAACMVPHGHVLSGPLLHALQQEGVLDVDDTRAREPVQVVGTRPSHGSHSEQVPARQQGTQHLEVLRHYQLQQQLLLPQEQRNLSPRKSWQQAPNHHSPQGFEPPAQHRQRQRQQQHHTDRQQQQQQLNQHPCGHHDLLLPPPDYPEEEQEQASCDQPEFRRPLPHPGYAEAPAVTGSWVHPGWHPGQAIRHQQRHLGVAPPADGSFAAATAARAAAAVPRTRPCPAGDAAVLSRDPAALHSAMAAAAAAAAAMALGSSAVSQLAGGPAGRRSPDSRQGPELVLVLGDKDAGAEAAKGGRQALHVWGRAGLGPGTGPGFSSGGVGCVRPGISLQVDLCDDSDTVGTAAPEESLREGGVGEGGGRGAGPPTPRSRLQAAAGEPFVDGEEGEGPGEEGPAEEGPEAVLARQQAGHVHLPTRVSAPAALELGSRQPPDPMHNLYQQQQQQLLQRQQQQQQVRASSSGGLHVDTGWPRDHHSLDIHSCLAGWQQPSVLPRVTQQPQFPTLYPVRSDGIQGVQGPQPPCSPRGHAAQPCWDTRTVQHGSPADPHVLDARRASVGWEGAGQQGSAAPLAPGPREHQPQQTPSVQGVVGAPSGAAARPYHLAGASSVCRYTAYQQLQQLQQQQQQQQHLQLRQLQPQQQPHRGVQQQQQRLGMPWQWP